MFADINCFRKVSSPGADAVNPTQCSCLTPCSHSYIMLTLESVLTIVIERFE